MIFAYSGGYPDFLQGNDLHSDSALFNQISCQIATAILSRAKNKGSEDALSQHFQAFFCSKKMFDNRRGPMV
ncbi:MAG: hypothetical protein LBJ64_08460 [Deltaproteobacteria bacterium]|jgi:hypothetical protein|nr:hypothetical protein [Deltaproteobacteria bacterium]